MIAASRFTTTPAARDASARAVAFVLVCGAFVAAWTALAGTPVERFVLESVTAAPATALCRLVWPDYGLMQRGVVLTAPGIASLSIANGCDGVDVWSVLVAGLLCARLSPGSRWAGVLVGSMLVWTLNQIRVLVLLHVYVHEREHFAHVHGFVLPAALLACVALFLTTWLRMRRGTC